MSAQLVTAESRGQRLRAPLLTIGGLAAATLALHVRDPHVDGSWGFCPSAALGFWCPGCGGLRGVNDLTHGDVAAAASSNLLLVLLAPLAVAALGVWTWHRWRGTTPPWPGQRATVTATTLLLVAMVVFTVLRNTPWGTWLAP